MSFDMGLVSIVIPVYNAEKYIGSMLDDVYSQTYNNVEVIVAYDMKSSDNTLDILNVYAPHHPLYILEGDDNSVGSARNRGAKHAKGNFIIFLDADDRVIPDYLSELVDVFAHHPDLDIVFGEYVVAKDSDVAETYRQAQTSQSGESLHANTELLEMWCNGKLGGFSWRWLVKREYFVAHEIQYPDYSRMEDDSYVLQLITNTDLIGHSKKQGYVYIQRPSSLSHMLPPLSQRLKDYRRRNADISRILSAKYPQYLSMFRKNIAWVVHDKLRERIHGTDISESLRK